MSGSNRQFYLTATVLNQTLLDYTAQDNLDSRLEMVCEIDSTTGLIRASDRNKYVGQYFYQALLQFPVISRKIAHWLSSQIEFSTLTLELSNVDGRFNHLELGGADYSGFVGKSVYVSVGLRDVASSYAPVFRGAVTEIGGASRTVKSLVLTARDQLDKANQNLPLTALTRASFPNIESDKVGFAVPVVYGDWTEAVHKVTIPARDLVPLQYLNTASIPAYCVNGIAATTLTTTNAQFIISENANVSFDTTQVWLHRGDQYTKMDPADIVNVNGYNNQFEIVQDGLTEILPPPGATGSSETWKYESSDNFYVRVVGKSLGGSNVYNPIAIARDILITYGGFSSGDFHANWSSYEGKASPTQSAIASIKSRAWVQEVQQAMTYALSILTQVRLEAFIDRDGKLRINSLHFEDWVSSPTYTLRNWDIVKDTFKPTIDERNNFNRARAMYNRDPSANETLGATGLYRNSAAIAQAGGKLITKEITYPNLYRETDVIAQLIEVLRLASATSELVGATLTSRSFLRELGDWVKVSVKIGSTIFDNVPAMVREIGYDPQGLKLPVQLWSMQAVRFPGWTPGYTGIVGGFDVTITAE